MGWVCESFLGGWSLPYRPFCQNFTTIKIHYSLEKSPFFLTAFSNLPWGAWTIFQGVSNSIRGPLTLVGLRGFNYLLVPPPIKLGSSIPPLRNLFPVLLSWAPCVCLASLGCKPHFLHVIISLRRVVISGGKSPFCYPFPGGLAPIFLTSGHSYTHFFWGGYMLPLWALLAFSPFMSSW